MKTRRSQQGYTLLEVIITSIMLGLLTYVSAPVFGTFMAARTASNNDTQALINKKIGQALLDWSAQQTAATKINGVSALGSLPNRCDNTLPYALIDDPKVATPPTAQANTCKKDILPFLQARGITPEMVVSDGTANRNRRVYQKLGPTGQNTMNSGGAGENAGICFSTGFLNQGPPYVNLCYESAVIYSTNCGASTCTAATNSDSAAIVPTGQVFSVETVGVVYPVPKNNWTAGSFDASKSSSHIDNQRVGYGVAYISTLPLQKQLLAQMTTNVSNLISGFKAYAAATGKYPFSSKLADGTTSALNPGTTAANLSNNDYCWTTWQDLAGVLSGSGRIPGATILATIGATGANPQTPWSGSIDYCANYDPATSKSAVPFDSATHPIYAAIRFTKDVSLGGTAITGSIAPPTVIIGF